MKNFEQARAIALMTDFADILGEDYYEEEGNHYFLLDDASVLVVHSDGTSARENTEPLPSTDDRRLSR